LKYFSLIYDFDLIEVIFFLKEFLVFHQRDRFLKLELILLVSLLEDVESQLVIWAIQVLLFSGVEQEVTLLRARFFAQLMLNAGHPNQLHLVIGVVIIKIV